jgi:hypothetical protein
MTMATRPETSLWLKVHVDMLDHPKFNNIDNDAIVMWLACLSYSKKFLTDGVVEISKIARFPKVKRWKKCLESLVENNIFSLTSDGKSIEIYGFGEWQQSRDEVEAKREEARIRKAEWRARNAAEKQAKDTGHNGTDAEQEVGTNEPVPLLREQSTESRDLESQRAESIYIADDSKSTSIKPKADSVSERKRNELWDAVVEVCSIDTSSIPKSQLSKIGKVVAELRVVKASPEDVHRRANIYKRKFDDAALTPTALLNHWAELTEKSIPVRRPTNAGSQRQAAQAAAVRKVLEASA